ncbi:MAG: hypothetical protein M1169_05595 [Firmicutes bacterium]|nr:hypothetical protein [Bacillota bacterium]
MANLLRIRALPHADHQPFAHSRQPSMTASEVNAAVGHPDLPPHSIPLMA